jgi:uncharacterized protein
MKIAILSDIHDNVWTLKAALPHLQGADALIFCGDFCSPFVVGLLATGFAKPVHAVLGNNDGDRHQITLNACKFDHLKIHGEFGVVELDGKHFAVTHYPEIARAVAASGQHDLVCYGHDHTFTLDLENRLLNPGTLMGYNPLGKTNVPATFVVYDTQTRSAQAFQVEAPWRSEDEPGKVAGYRQ